MIIRSTVSLLVYSFKKLSSLGVSMVVKPVAIIFRGSVTASPVLFLP